MVILVDARFDQATKAESALENTQRIYRAGLIRQEPVQSLEEIPELIPVEGMTSEKWRQAFNIAHKPLIELARMIIEKQKWSANELAKRIDEVSYFGPKTSRLAARWLNELVKDLEINMSTYKVPIDRLLYRVACRLGIVDPYKDKYWISYEGGPADQKMQNFAHTAFPHNPGPIDKPMWSEGRLPENGGHCNTRNPIHSGCIFDTICPRMYETIDPSKIGLVDTKEMDSLRSTKYRGYET